MITIENNFHIQESELIFLFEEVHHAIDGRRFWLAPIKTGLFLVISATKYLENVANHGFVVGKTYHPIEDENPETVNEIVIRLSSALSQAKQKHQGKLHLVPSMQNPVIPED